MVYFSKMTEKGVYRMNFFMGKKFVGPGGGKKDQGPEVVFDNGEESNKRMKRMLRPIKIAIVVAVLAIAAFDSFYTVRERDGSADHLWPSKQRHYLRAQVQGAFHTEGT